MTKPTAASVVASYLRDRGAGDEADLMEALPLSDRAGAPGIRAFASGGAELVMTGDIGFDVTAAGVASAMAGLDPNAPLTIRVNSYGGVAFEGLGIHNILARHPGRKTVVVDALAASAASIIAMAGDEIVMPKASFLMIHNGAGLTVGNRADHAETIALLARVDAAMTGIYASRTGLPAEEIESLMAAETWLSADDAVAKGFATRVEGEAAALPVTARAANTVRAYAHAPAAVLAMVQPAAPDPITPTTEGSMPDTDTPAAGQPPAAPPAPAPVLEVKPVAASLSQLQAIAARAKLGPDFIVAQLDARSTEEQARDVALEILAQRSPDRPAGTVPPNGAGNAVTAIRASILRRGQVTKPEVLTAAAGYEGMNLRDMAAEFITAQTGRASGYMAPDKLFREAFGIRASSTVGMLTTSDFGQLLGDTAGEIVLDSFLAASTEWRKVARTFNFDDFKEKQIRGGFELPDLELVREHGEITYGTLARAFAKVKLETFAKGFAFSRQAIINNDLEEFTSNARAYGVMAARSLSARVWRVFIQGTTSILMPDGLPLFHASHGNLAAVDGPINDATLAVAETAMMQQAVVPGRPLGLTPRYLIVGINRRHEARIFLNSETTTTVINGVATTARNTYFGNLELIYEPSFPPNAWALMADPALRPVVAVPLLNGVETPDVVAEASFDTFGVKVRVSLDYEAAPIDTIGVYYNPGPA
jgi:ATP-dependent protease ClpP protease subunit